MNIPNTPVTGLVLPPKGCGDPDAVMAALEAYTADCCLALGVCPDPSAHSLAIANATVRYGAEWLNTPAARALHETNLAALTQAAPRPRSPIISDHTVVTIAFAAMLGALLGWLAPALVAASIICLLLLATYIERTNRWAGHSACVHRMMRRW